MIRIRQITRENAGDLLLKNDPFSMPGRMIPELKNGIWSYRIESFDTVSQMTFPDEAYDFDALCAEGVAFGAYDQETCVGLLVCKRSFWKYMYVYDLKVSASHRGQGIGRALIAAGKQEAHLQGYQGLYLQAQDNNLNACLFYLKAGFEIGGFDNHVYNGTSQAGKADIVFYTKQEVAP